MKFITVLILCLPLLLNSCGRVKERNTGAGTNPDEYPDYYDYSTSDISGGAIADGTASGDSAVDNYDDEYTVGEKVPGEGDATVAETTTGGNATTTNVTAGNTGTTAGDTRYTNMASGRFYIIAGSFLRKREAERLSKEFIRDGYSVEILPGDNGYNRVAVAQYTDKARARKELETFRRKYARQKFWLLIT